MPESENTTPRQVEGPTWRHMDSVADASFLWLADGGCLLASSLVVVAAAWGLAICRFLNVVLH